MDLEKLGMDQDNSPSCPVGLRFCNRFCVATLFTAYRSLCVRLSMQTQSCPCKSMSNHWCAFMALTVTLWLTKRCVKMACSHLGLRERSLNFHNFSFTVRYCEERVQCSSLHVFERKILYFSSIINSVRFCA